MNDTLLLRCLLFIIKWMNRQAALAPGSYPSIDTEGHVLEEKLRDALEQELYDS